MSGGDGSLLEKGLSPNSWDSDKWGSVKSMSRLRKSPCFEEIAQELKNGLRPWKRTKTIKKPYINRGDLIEAKKVWLYFINSVFIPLKHVRPEKFQFKEKGQNHNFGY